MGLYYWDQNGTTSKPGGKVLVPAFPGFTTRFGFRTHSCLNAFGPSVNSPYCSEGCITGSTSTVQELNDFLGQEWGAGKSNSLMVVE
jgi:hypothetical protein